MDALLGRRVVRNLTAVMSVGSVTQYAPSPPSFTLLHPLLGQKQVKAASEKKERIKRGEGGGQDDLVALEKKKKKGRKKKRGKNSTVLSSILVPFAPFLCNREKTTWLVGK